MNDAATKSKNQVCSHRPPCPGCPRFGEDGFASNAARRIDNWAQRADHFASHHGQRFAWRHRARLAIRGRAQSPKVGIFQASSHSIADIPNCPIHHPSINAAAKALRAAIRSTGILPYHESAHKGELRYAQFVVERSTQRVQITLVTKSPQPQPVQELIEVLARLLGDELHSIWWNIQPEQTNTIFGHQMQCMVGEPHLIERLPHATIFLPADAFGQANPAAADVLIEEIRSHVTKGSQVVDLYSGVGPIGLSVLDLAETVTFVEIAPGSIRGLSAGIDNLTPHDQKRTFVRVGTVADHLDALNTADIVIADPPRKGLDKALMQRLQDSLPKLTILVHCGLEAFDQDLTTLVADGPFHIDSLSAHDFFPHSDHVEMLTVLRPSRDV